MEECDLCGRSCSSSSCVNNIKSRKSTRNKSKNLVRNKKQGRPVILANYDTKNVNSECDSFQNELAVYFLCTRFFEGGNSSYVTIPEPDLERLLRLGAGNPSQWIAMCGDCSGIVHQAKDLHREMTRIQHELHDLREQLQQRLSLPGGTPDSEEKANSTTMMESIRQKLRKKLADLEVGVKGDFEIVDGIMKIEMSLDEDEELGGNCDSSLAYTWPLHNPEDDDNDSFNHEFILPDDDDLEDDGKIMEESLQTDASHNIKPHQSNSTGRRESSRRKSKQRKHYYDFDNEDDDEKDVKSEDDLDALNNSSRTSEDEDNNYEPQTVSSKTKKKQSKTKDSKSPGQRKSSTSKTKSSANKVKLKGPKSRNKGPVEDRTCPICQEVLGRPERLKDHINYKHEKATVYPCDNKGCDRMFYSADSKRKHSRVHLTPIQVKHLTLAKKLDEVKYSGALPEYEEPIDPEEKPDEEIVNRVLKRTCHVCQKLFQAVYQKVRHVEQTHGHVKLNENFMRIEKVTLSGNQIKHLRLANKLDAVNYSDFMDADGQEALTVNLDGKTHDPQIVQNILDRTCEVCKELFANEFRKSYHVNRFHENSKHVCEKCGRNFLYEKNLIQHQKFCQKTERDFKCDVEGCTGAFRTPDVLRRHKKIVHEKLYRQVCPHCGKILCTPNNLRVHILTLHTENAPRKFQCHLCPKSFLTKVLHKQHLNSKQHGGPGGNKYKGRPAKSNHSGQQKLKKIRKKKESNTEIREEFESIYNTVANNEQSK